jgi:ketosteroid isomerase-like protein
MKKLVLIISFAISLFACSPTESSQSKQNVATVKAMFEAFNAHDWKKMATYYAEKPLFLAPEFGGKHIVQTHADIIKNYSKLSDAFPDIQDIISLIAPVGEDKVLVQFMSKGTLADKSAKMELQLCSVLTLKDGKITMDEVYYDADLPLKPIDAKK